MDFVRTKTPTNRLETSLRLFSPFTTKPTHRLSFCGLSPCRATESKPLDQKVFWKESMRLTSVGTLPARSKWVGPMGGNWELPGRRPRQKNRGQLIEKMIDSSLAGAHSRCGECTWMRIHVHIDARWTWMDHFFPSYLQELQASKDPQKEDQTKRHIKRDSKAPASWYLQSKSPWHHRSGR